MCKRSAALILCLGVFTGAAAQQESAVAAAEVTVSKVRTGLHRVAGQEAWYAVEVAIRVKATGSGRSRFADRVGVTLSLATESREAPEGLEFYQTQATAVSLEVGPHVFQFVLPPEIVKRDRLHGDLRFWVVDLSRAGQALPLNREQVGAGFSSAAALENFRTQVALRATENAGTLLPVHLTRLANGPGTDATPSMVRLEHESVN